MNLEKTSEAQRGFDKNCASLDPVPTGQLYMDYATGNLRDEAEQEGVNDIFPDEANFVLEALNRLVEENAYTKEYADQILLSYVQRYCI